MFDMPTLIRIFRKSRRLNRQQATELAWHFRRLQQHPEENSAAAAILRREEARA